MRLLLQMIQRGLHVNGVPQYDGIGHQPERTKLIFLSFAIPLANLPPLAVANDTGNGMPSLAPV